MKRIIDFSESAGEIKQYEPNENKRSTHWKTGDWRGASDFDSVHVQYPHRGCEGYGRADSSSGTGWL